MALNKALHKQNFYQFVQCNKKLPSEVAGFTTDSGKLSNP